MNSHLKKKLYALAEEDYNSRLSVEAIGGMLLYIGTFLIVRYLAYREADKSTINFAAGIMIVLIVLFILFSGFITEKVLRLTNGTSGNIFAKYDLDNNSYYLLRMRDDKFICSCKPLAEDGKERTAMASFSDKELRTGYQVVKEYYYDNCGIKLYMEPAIFENLSTLVKAPRGHTYLALNEAEYQNIENSYENNDRISLTDFSIINYHV